MATLQKHGGVGTPGDVRVADGARVVACEPTHAPVVAVLGHAHTALVTVHVVIAYAHPAYATVHTMEDILRMVVLPQMARVAVVAVLAWVHRALRIRTARTRLLVALAEHALHMRHSEAVELGLVVEHRGAVLLGVALPARDGRSGGGVDGREPVFVVGAEHLFLRVFGTGGCKLLSRIFICMYSQPSVFIIT